MSRRPPLKPKAVKCPYCGQQSELTTGAVLYPHRPDLHDLRFYRCAPCGAWVGCHKGTLNPLGRLANADLRKAKGRAHEAFDPLWKSGLLPRHEAYGELASELGISRERCHIGYFDVAECERVIVAIAKLRARLKLPAG